MDINSEKTLIEGLRKGDEDSYKHLYNLFYPELRAYLNTVSGSIEVSKDLSQQVFIKVWKKRASLSINSSLKNYIFRIGYNLFIDLQRKNKKDLQLLDQLKHDALHEIVDLPNDDLDKKIRLVLSEIDKLPEKCKNVFLLAKKDGLKYSEIAEELNISIKTVERHMTKALRRLRQGLKR
ncbi:RNA polymerase sigma factor [Gelidibacter gilvus]|uniref:Sigma-70 family RNA polymerase sigma factor n=1 Tax=Gelidibacter gilvus TaxID=59602 RepID=A0A4Q0XKA1_9FLAO|nr:sigma-70 family RNA polymerase sigma factor [Gelidibacter gilvus]RXJ52652.1 sigma-70 family RNA polymerase sigma factor [Gelidibacter gilvus]